MTTQTPGRLTVRKSKISDAHLMELTDDCGDFELIAPIKDADLAARLAASYNACLGVPLDVLERIDVARLVEAAAYLTEHWRGGGKLTDAVIRLRAALGDER